jgi:predicted DNA binding CopG/RHH family protein
MSTKFIDNEEKEIIESYEKWEWKQVPNFETRKEELKKLFANNINSKKAISIRLLENDISKLKSKAIQEWIPYQTLISSIIHKYANWNLTFR